MYRDALAIRKSALGDNHPSVATSLNGLRDLLARKHGTELSRRTQFVS